MPYKAFYSLQSEPFSNAPNSAMYFSCLQHERIQAKLRYSAESMKGLALLVGEAGCGKTMISRRLAASFPKSQYQVILLVVVHSNIDADWLFRRIALQLGIEKPSKKRLTLLSQLYRHLIKNYEAGKKTVVLIDEAQMLASKEILAEFRGLLNFEIPGSKLIHFILFGLPKLDQRLDEDLSLKQRVAVRCQLEALDYQTVAAYIKHRLELVGGDAGIFSDQALEAIFDYSHGVVRAINTICDNALFEGSMNGMTTIDRDLIEQCANDLGLVDRQSQKPASDQLPKQIEQSEDVLKELEDFDELLKEMESY